ncbi:hypothetical protein Tco_1184557 [Tanacetum coccineum]
MVLVDHTGWKLRRKHWTGTTDQLIEDLEAAYDNAPNMFSIRIHYGGNFQRYPGRMYVSGRVDIFDMVDIDLFTVVALNMIVLKLGYTGKSDPMSFKLIEVYIKHGVTALDSNLRAPRFRATLEEITDEPGSIATNRTEKILLLTWHESSETTKEPVCDSVTPISLPQHDSSTPCKDSLSGVHGVDTQSHVLPTIQSQFSDINLSFISQQVTASHVIDNVMRQLSFDETELDGEAGFADVAGSGVDIETQSELPVCEEPDVGRTQEPILAEEFSVKDVVLEDYVSSGEDVEQYNGEFDELASSDGQFFFDDEGTDTEYGVYMDLPFNNIGVPNLVSNDVLEGENVDIINADGFDSDPGNDEETNYRKRRLAELRTEMEGVINASGQWNKGILKLFKKDECQDKSNNVQKSCLYLQCHKCLGDDIDLHSNSNFTFISDRQKGIIPAIKTVYPSAEHIYFLRHIHENIKQGWCGQAYKDLLWRAASATNVRDFEKCRAKSDLLLNNIYEVFNGKIVRGRDNPVITLLEYIREYCMKRIVNIQGVIDKCTGPLTPTVTIIIESIKKEAHLMKVQWNRANKYQVSSLLGDQCVVDVVGRPRKKRKRSKHEDEPFVKDGKLSRKGRTITCQSCENIGHNKATCKGQGRKVTTGGNNAEASGAGVVIGLSAAAGEGGAGGPDGREMGDGVPTQSSAAGGASECMTGYTQLVHDVETSYARLQNHISSMRGYTQLDVETSDNGNFPLVDEEEVTSKKLAPMAEEMIMLIEALKRNCISPSDSHPPVIITKNMSAVIDNLKFTMVDEEDLIFKKISPMAEEILEMLPVCVAKKIKVSGFIWYNDEIREHVEKLVDGWRTTVSYFVEKTVKKYADDE